MSCAPRCVGLLAHVDAGKTTLTEAMLYLSGAIRKLGRVDHRDSFLDHDDQERARGITIFSKQARLRWKDCEFTILDTPGHIDFSSETERTIQVLDAAVLVISGTDGVQAHTETLWSLLERYGIPTFCFITKMDSSFLPKEELMQDLHTHLSPGCIDMTQDRAALDEEAALLDEDALELYTASGCLSDDQFRQMIAKREMIPCLFGSGMKLSGVEALLDALALYSTPAEATEAFGARVFKIARDSRGKRLTYLKVTGGMLSVRNSIRYQPRHSSETLEEKIAEIRLYSGQKYENTESVPAGSVCAVLGLSRTWPGQGLGACPDGEEPVLEPVMGYRLILPKGTDAKTVLPKLRQLEEEDPLLRIVYTEESGDIQLQLMGSIQLEVLKKLLSERFDLEADFGPGRILYRETIANTVEGVGHFEPLRHYAEVHLLLEPGARGSGLQFGSCCSTDELDLNWQRLILTHLEEKQHLGVLTGSPITDMKITLAAGRAHLKHTEGGDFRQATYRAVRQGLMQAQSVLLEPYYDYTLEVPTEQSGRAISDMHAMGGEHQTPETLGVRTVLNGTVPAAAAGDYALEVAAYTGGRGHFTCRFSGYRPCENAKNITEELGYSPEADLANTPDSVFCAHGAGFTVKWNEVPLYMHLPSVLNGTGNLNRSHASVPSPSVSIDEKELEAIMEREFGPIRRKQYTSPTVNGKAVQDIRFVPRRERLIVDGYNLIFAWTELKALAAEDLSAARDKLIDMLLSYSSFTNRETVLVFDAYKVPGGIGERSNSETLHVLYTRENESADLYIERLADEIGKDELVRVVTSDSLIRLTALRAGVLRTSAAEFIAEVQDALTQMRNSPYIEKQEP